MISMPDRWLILLGAALLMVAAPLSGRTDAIQTALSAAAAAAARGDAAAPPGGAAAIVGRGRADLSHGRADHSRRHRHGDGAHY